MYHLKIVWFLNHNENLIVARVVNSMDDHYLLNKIEIVMIDDNQCYSEKLLVTMITIFHCYLDKPKCTIVNTFILYM